jgi:hypothetical protein
MFKHLAALLPVLLLCAAPASAATKGDARIGTPAPDFLAKDIAGKKQSLSQYKGKIVVLEWNNPGCPFVHKFYDGGTMQALQADLTGKGVVWLTFNSAGEGKEGFMNAVEAGNYVDAQKSHATTYILDPLGRLGHQYGATATPHMFVIDKKGNFAYAGALDDRPTPDPKDIPAATNYVTAAVDALLAGKKPEVTSSKAYGCSVKYKDPEGAL